MQRAEVRAPRSGDTERAKAWRQEGVGGLAMGIVGKRGGWRGGWRHIR